MIDVLQHTARVHVRILENLDQIAHGRERHAELRGDATDLVACASRAPRHP
jgi:hypothetical protein